MDDGWLNSGATLQWWQMHIAQFKIKWFILNCFEFHDCFSETTPFTSSASFRTIIFVVLTLQATCYFSLLRYSRTRPNKMYFSSTAVFLAEVVKLLVTLMVIFFQCGNLREFVLFLINNLFTNPMATIKLSVPSVLYIVQNNLVYVAMTHLESTTFQVCTSHSMYLPCDWYFVCNKWESKECTCTCTWHLTIQTTRARGVRFQIVINGWIPLLMRYCHE